MDKIEKEPPHVQSGIVKKMMEENIGMYKAAVSTTKRMEKEYFIRSNLICEENDRGKAKIEKIEQELDDLYIEKEFLALKDEQSSLNNIPEIRIRNQLSHGTVIEGTCSGLIMNKTYYGVKLKEITNQGKSNIVVEGYFE